MLFKWGKNFYALLRCSLRKNSSSLLAHTPNVRCINKNWLYTPSSVLRFFFPFLSEHWIFFSYFSVIVIHKKSGGSSVIPKLKKCQYFYCVTNLLWLLENTNIPQFLALQSAVQLDISLSL